MGHVVTNIVHEHIPRIHQVLFIQRPMFNSFFYFRPSSEGKRSTPEDSAGTVAGGELSGRDKNILRFGLSGLMN